MTILQKIKTKLFQSKTKFKGSQNYWENRYLAGGNSGVGSYDKIAKFKAEIINDFVLKNNISTIIEFGCGDGNQLSLAKYENYIGLDVSPTAINICYNKFKNDSSKSFFLYSSLDFYDNHSIFKADISLSLDVIYHLVEDNIFEKYMLHLFNSAKKFVIIFSNNHSNYGTNHVKSRRFTDWIEKNMNKWELKEKIDNEIVNWQDFYIYKQIN